jgi:uncharacterized membrane protein YcaP (DUF421 family)
MSTFNLLFGEGEHLTILQMSCRALVMYIITLTLIRFGGMRIFGKKSAFDTIVVIMLGAVLARGIVGASPFFATVAAAVVMIGIDRCLAWLTMKSGGLARLVKGKPLLLYANGELNWENMKMASLSKSDLIESLRLQTNGESLEAVISAFMETNGLISFVVKKEQ